MKKLFPLLMLFSSLLIACSGGGEKKRQSENKESDQALQKEVKAYLENYNKKFQDLMYTASKAHWALNTKIVPGDTLTKKAAEKADEAFAAYTGSKENIEKSKQYLKDKEKLTDLQVKQLEAILYMAGSNPEVAGEVVKKRIAAETAQTEKLFGFDFKMDGKSVSTNDLDRILKKSDDLDKRLKAWESSKEVGIGLKDGLTKLRSLRNQCVQALGYNDYFAYQVSDYGLSSEELRKICKNMIEEVWPLYRELHTYARYELAQKYGEEVPDMLPAHWLPNRWGQDWTGMVEAEGIDLDAALSQHDAEWIVKKGEEFYVSLGFDPLPESFYRRSSLYPLPDSVDYKKNNHASAWHLDNADDIRSLMSVEPTTEWWGTTLHELGHIYYYRTYTNPDVPIILRGGANRAYHEAMGTLIGLASMQKPFLQQMGLVDKDAQTDSIQSLLKEAMDYVVLIPWGAGVMTEFEHDLYADELPRDRFNKRWWELKKEYMGIVPPYERGEEYCDAASKTHINNDAAQYYDYAMSNILLFQFHDHISENILKQDPHSTNYYGNKGVGDFLKKLMYPGATVDWRDHLKENLGEELSAKSMVNYFKPLMDYLKKENKGRKHTLPESL